MTISDIDTRDAFFDELLALARKDRNLIFMTADMGAFSLEQFKKELPQQFLNVGVAEQNMISVAAGLAMGGKRVFVYTIVPFATLRCYEQIKVDLCCMNLPVTVIGIGAGVMYGGDGPTHHALHDIAVMRALPEMTIFNPADASSTQACAQMSYHHNGPVYVRIEKGKLPSLYPAQAQDFSAGISLLREGQDGMILASGLMVHYALAAADLLAQKSLQVGVVDLYRVKPLDPGRMQALTSGVRKLITLEEHALTGGIGSAVAEWMADERLALTLKRLAFPDVHCHEPYSREQLHEQYGLSAQGIAERVQTFLQDGS